MTIRKAQLKSFNVMDYTATVQIAGSYKAYLPDITVARNIPEAEMAAGRNVCILFNDTHDAKEAVIIAVYD
jgi:hypothetical protein